MTIRDRLFMNRGIEIQAVDTTAAGDTFIGSLAARLSLGKEFPEAVRYANRAASRTCAEERSSKLYPFYGGCIIIKAAGVKKQLCRLWHGWKHFVRAEVE